VAVLEAGTDPEVGLDQACLEAGTGLVLGTVPEADTGLEAALGLEGCLGLGDKPLEEAHRCLVLQVGRRLPVSEILEAGTGPEEGLGLACLEGGTGPGLVGGTVLEEGLGLACLEAGTGPGGLGLVAWFGMGHTEECPGLAVGKRRVGCLGLAGRPLVADIGLEAEAGLGVPGLELGIGLVGAGCCKG